jgi:hypothetical protein
MGNNEQIKSSGGDPNSKFETVKLNSKLGGEIGSLDNLNASNK